MDYFKKCEGIIFLSFPIAICLLLVHLLRYMLALVSRQVIAGKKSLRKKVIEKRNKNELNFCIQIAKRHYFSILEVKSIYLLQFENLGGMSL